MLRLVVGALLLVLAFAGGYAVAACKTVTLTVDGTAMRVTTMKSRVIDIVEENGFSVDDRDDLYPAAGVQVHDADTIVLRRSVRCRSRWMVTTLSRCGRPRRRWTRRWPNSR